MKASLQLATRSISPTERHVCPTHAACTGAQPVQTAPSIPNEARDRNVSPRDHSQRRLPRHEGRTTARLAEVKPSLRRRDAGALPLRRRRLAWEQYGPGARWCFSISAMNRTTPECLQPQLRLRRPLEAPLPPERPLPQGSVVRAYAPGDEAAWAEVLHHNGRLGDWDEARIRAMIGRDEPELRLEGTFFAVRSGELVATACSLSHRSPTPDREVLEIGWVGVVPCARGHGLAYILSRQILAHWQARVVGDVFVLTDDWRVPAIVTYLQLGFRPEIVHSNQVERWHTLALGFEGELREWATPAAH